MRSAQSALCLACVDVDARADVSARLRAARAPACAWLVLHSIALNGGLHLPLPRRKRARRRHYGTRPVVLGGMAHDVMLDTNWRQAADALRDWLGTAQFLTS